MVYCRNNNRLQMVRMKIRRVSHHSEILHGLGFIYSVCYTGILNTFAEISKIFKKYPRISEIFFLLKMIAKLKKYQNRVKQNDPKIGFDINLHPTGCQINIPFSEEISKDMKPMYVDSH